MRVALALCLLCVTAVVMSFDVEVQVDLSGGGGGMQRRVWTFGGRRGNRPRNCVEARRRHPRSGVVNIYPKRNNKRLRVYCDQDTDGGGWLVFQRRQDASVNFTRNWASYKRGFGDLSGNFWLGLDALHKLTSGQTYKLRVDLTKWSSAKGYATYSNFSISGSSDNYRLRFNSFTGGSAGDSLTYHKNMQFSTADADHDKTSGGNCARHWHSAWWYNICHHSHLNGIYKSSRVSGYDGVVWYHFDSAYSLKFSEMKFKPM
ncbi:ficolin-1-A-like [Littorina saxatilis]|uniref:Fibrinogen C-terminal domain-containing protein n=1 Tax=Littorina saxatilis TaxID=31220 RepID=A0AAN9BLX4_9CAEN